MQWFRFNFPQSSRAWPVLAASLLPTLLVAGANAQDIVRAPSVEATGKLTIANTLDYAPFEYLDADGKPTGIIIELANGVADLVKADLDVQRTPFAAMMPGLASGRFNIAWETFSVTPDRLAQVDFVMFLKAGLAASTRADLVGSFSGDLPLCGKRVGVSAGSASDFLVDTLSEQCAAAGRPLLDKSVFNTSQDIVQAVLSDRIDARIDDATASSYFQTTSNGQMVVLPTLYNVAPLGLAIAKNDRATADMMVSALSVLFENGTYGTILDKYGMSIHAIAKPYYVNSVDSLRQQ
jgi:polar amino acid transport system substrate-binding protein